MIRTGWPIFRKASTSDTERCIWDNILRRIFVKVIKAFRVKTATGLKVRFRTCVCYIMLKLGIKGN